MVYFLFFGLPAIVVIGLYLFLQRNKNHSALQQWEESKKSGLTEPVSLHPVIDPSRCLGCGTCVTACPEGKILGLVQRKAVLVSPTSCIGHGACREACPTNAISLVFGSATRGVEIPLLNSDFETSVPGVFIAGELGGMGLIKNAIAQGQQAVNAIAKRVRKNNHLPHDLVIVGAGPAGLSAALTAKQKNLRYVVLEQDRVGGTIAHYPRGKIVMTRPAVLPIVGKFQFKEASKEALVEFWQSVAGQSGLSIRTGMRVDNIEPVDGGFRISTNTDVFDSHNVLLALGRRGTPRKLGSPGEELPKVVYQVVDPEQYAGKRVLIVGGGDSALEAALAIAEQPGTDVVLSYRSATFSRAKPKNRERVSDAHKNQTMKVLLESTVKKITPASVVIETKNGEKELPNDAVVVCVGGILPTPFLKKIGIDVEEKYGTV